MREEGRGARKALVEARVDVGVERRHLRWHPLAGQHREQLLHVGPRHGLVQRDRHRLRGGLAHVDPPRRGRRHHRVGGRPRQLHRDGVEVDVVGHGVPQALGAQRQRGGVPVHAPRDVRQPFGSVPHRVHPRHHRQQHLRRADVARRLLATDVLLPRPQRHAQRRLPLGVPRDPNDPSRHQALELVARGEEGRMRAAESHRHAKALRVSHADVGAPFTRRDQERERQQVGRRNDERLGRVRPFGNVSIVVHGTGRRRVLQQDGKVLGAKCRGPRVAHRHAPAAHLGARAHDVDGLRVAAGVDEDHRLVVSRPRGMRQRHRLGRRRPLVQQRGIGNGKPRQVDDHGLEVQQRFQSSLRDLRLVWRVRRVPAGVLQDVPLDDGRDEGIVVAVPQVRAVDAVALGHAAQLSEYVMLRARRADGEVPPQPDLRRDGGVDEGIE